MLENRDYMRQPEYDDSRFPRRFGVRWSLTVCFLIAYALVFFAQEVVARYFPQQRGLLGNLALSVSGLSHGYVWQLVTYQFLHAGFLHLFFNGWVIYTFGLILEEELGGKRFAALMLCSGIIGGVLQGAVGWMWPQYFGGPVVGASACAFGLVAAFAALHPYRELTMLVFFIIPVTLAARTLLIVSAAIALIGFGIRFDNVAHMAHLGGMLAGWLFIRVNRGAIMARLGGWVAREEEPPTRAKVVIRDEAPSKEALEREVDAILDKISAQGLDSLTRKERETLESARRKMTPP